MYREEGSSHQLLKEENTSRGSPAKTEENHKETELT
jgi:hypothetical protein